MSGSLSRRPKVLVTGGAGFIGRWLADQLALRYEVVIYDLTQPRIDRPGQSHIEGDVRDLDRLKWAMAGCDAVFHLAALVGVSECQAQEERMNAINVGGTSMVAAAVRATPTVKSVLAVSSSEVYGEGTGRLLDEDSPLKPITAYGVSKLRLEEIMSQLQSMSRRVTVIRPFNAYGPHQCSSFVVARFCQLAHRGESLPIVGTGTQTRVFTFVSDIVRGMMSAFDYGLHRRGGYDVFNLASRQSSSILHLAKLVGELAASPGTTTLEYTPPEALGRSSQQEIQHRRPSIEKAARLLGFEPSVYLREGLDRTMAWYRETSADGMLRPGAVSSPGPGAVSPLGAAAGRTAVG
jgi:UDP-glucose 4-epimerase